MTDWTCPVCHSSIASCCAATAALMLSKAPQGEIEVPLKLLNKAPHEPALGVGVSSKASRSKPKPTLNYDSDPEFNRFWSAYPNKVSKADAFRAWGRLRKSGVNLEAIIHGAARYRDNPRRDPEKTKYPDGWLNGRRWEDVAGPADPSPSAIQVKTQAEIDAEWERQRAEDDAYLKAIFDDEDAADG